MQAWRIMPAACPTVRQAEARADRAQRGMANGGGGAVAGLGQSLLDGADDQPAHHARIAEAHFGLAGMDIDVDLPARRFQK